MRIKLKLPLPFISNQVDLEIKKTSSKLDPLDFYILLIPYLGEKKEINLDMKFVAALKEKFNLGDNFFQLINERIKVLIKLKMLSLKFIPEFNKEAYVGNLVINPKLVHLFDNNIFLSFSEDTKTRSIFYYQNLCILNKEFEFVKELNEKYQPSNIKINPSSFSIPYIDKELASNIINQKIVSPNDEVIVNYIFALEKKLIFIDFEFDFEINCDNFTILIPSPEDLKTLEYIDHNMNKLYFDELINHLDNELSNDLFTDSIENKTLIKKIFKFNNDFNLIKERYEKQKNMFSNAPYKTVILDNNFFILGSEKQEFKFLVLKDKCLPITSLNQYKFDNEKEEFAYLEKYFNFKGLCTQHPINNVDKKYIKFILETSINKINTISDKFKLFDFYLVNYEIFKEYIDKLNLDLEQSFFNKEIHELLINLFKYDANNKRKYVEQFKNFEINVKTQKLLNSIYNFDYSKSNKYFKDSTDEMILNSIYLDLEKLNEISNTENIEKLNQLFLKLKTKIKQLKWIDHKFIFNNKNYKKVLSLLVDNNKK